MKIGLFFGSFNPIHVGHLIIAEYMATRTDLDQVWFVVSPHNPLKPRNTLANDYLRLELVRRAIGDNPRIGLSDIEFKLPKPSYTIDTLVHLSEKYPQHQFTLIMGGDNVASLPKWKNYEILLRDYPIYVYKRPNYEMGELAQHPSIRIFADVPMMEISATFIRESIKNGLSVKYMVTDEVFEELVRSGTYR